MPKLEIIPGHPASLQRESVGGGYRPRMRLRVGATAAEAQGRQGLCFVSRRPARHFKRTLIEDSRTLLGNCPSHFMDDGTEVLKG